MNSADLSRKWAGLRPMERVLFFKLLSEERALEFYETLSAEDRYFLLGAFPDGAIAPLARALPSEERARITRLSPAAYARMIESLAESLK